MSKLLFIETSTSLCSTALAEDGCIVCSRRSSEPRAHASLTAVFVKEMMDEAGWAAPDAVCVSMGPGSYTGLRVGVSTAKGLCFGAGIPLIAIGTLDVLVSGALGAKRLIVPMIDARRMEVYTAVFSPEGKQLTPVEAKIIGPESFADELAAGPVLFIGDGALKCKDVLTSPNAFFRKADPLASAMAPLAEAAFQEKGFEDLAYFEPFYLKDFIATVSRKNLF